MSLKQVLLGSAAAFCILAAAPQAHAVVVTGSSGGTFASISGCGGDNCRINSTSNGSSTQVEWGYGFFETGSKLTANDINFSTNTDANDVTLAKLTWSNESTSSSNTPDLFNVNYTLSIAFTSPSSSSDTELFNLSIFNTVNPPGDGLSGLTMSDLSNLVFTLAGVTVSDLHFAIESGSNGAFSNTSWTNPEDRTSVLLLKADLKAVPEPGTLAILATGLIGLGGMVRRRRQS